MNPGDFSSELAKVVSAIKAWAQGPGGLVLGVVAVLAGIGVIYYGYTLAFSPSTSGAGDETRADLFFEISTGSLSGTYYPLGNVIASVIANPEGSVRCSDETRCGPPGLSPVVQAAEGSVSNIEAVHGGYTASAFAQANVVNQAYHGLAPFEEPYSDLRVISGLYGEAVHLVTMRGSDIHSLEDLRGHRVSIDLRGSGTFGIASLILDAAGLNSTNTEILEERADHAADMLLAGEIDAFFFVAGAPVRVIADLTNLNMVRLVPLSGPAVNRLIGGEPYLTGYVIPGGTYLDQPSVETIGVTALWIVSDEADQDLVYRITRALWNPKNRSQLAQGPAQARVTNPRVAIEGVPIPFHPGAEQFYEEEGLLSRD